MSVGLAVSLAISLAVVVPVLVAPSAQAAPVGTITTVARGMAEPVGIVTGPDGNLWFTSPLNNTIGRMTPAGAVNLFTGTSINAPYSITVGSDGALWFTNEGNASIGRITTAGVVTNFTDPSVSSPTGIASGPDGALWFINEGNSSIGRITTVGAVTHHIDPRFDQLSGITAGPDGALWFTDQSTHVLTNAVGRITTGFAVSIYSSSVLSFAQAITTGPDGNLWIAAANAVVRVTPDGTSFTPFSTGATNLVDIATGPDGNLWATGENGSIIRVTTAGTVTSFSAPSTTVLPFTLLEGVAAGPDGNVYFLDALFDQVDRVTPAGVVSIASAPGVANPEAITTGPDGNLWFTNANQIGRITPAGVVTIFGDASISLPTAITSGPDGNLWFTNQGNDSIGRVTPAGVVSNFTDASIVGPAGITSGPDGNLWFTNQGDDSIGRITPAGAVSSFTSASVSSPSAITLGPDDALWFLNDDSLGRVTTAGTISAVHDATLNSPTAITTGPDGNLWVTNAVNPSIDRVTTGGLVTHFTDPHIGDPNDITSGPDGNLWFTDSGAGPGPSSVAVSRITPSGTVTAFSDPALLTPAGITLGPDGNLWVADPNASAIDRVSAVAKPGPPTGVNGSAEDSAVQVFWSAAPANGSPVTSYTVTASPGGGTCAWSSGPLTCVIAGLTDGTSYAFTVTATNGQGTGPASAASTPVTPSAGDGFHRVAPVRILDSRPGVGNVGGFATPWGAGTVRDLAVGGVGGVPADADAVVLNVTVTNPTAASFLSLFPAGGTAPTVSNLNFTPGQTIPNQVTVALGTAGKVSILNHTGAADVVADVTGYYDQSGGDGFHAITPARVLDSRPGPGNTGGFTTPWDAGTSRDVTVGGRGGVPADADAVVLNVTATNPSGSSYLSIWPQGSTRPTVSSLNWTAGETIPNAVTVGLNPANGQVSVYNFVGHTDVVIDVAGYFTTAGGDRFHPLAPRRLLDSRAGATQVGQYDTSWGTDATRSLTVADQAGVPDLAQAMVANVTVTDTGAGSYLSLWPQGAAQPTVSSLNWTAGETIPNAVTVELGTAGAVSVYNLVAQVDVLVDVAGWYG